MLDLVARVRVAAAATPAAAASLLLVHIEIEAPDRTTQLTPRLPYYYHFLRDKHQLPVLPIMLYLKVGLDGIGIDCCVEELWGPEINRFQYLYVGLPGLDGVEYLRGENWLGVALSVLMKIPPGQAAWLGAEALRRLAEAPLSEQERFLLGDCVQAHLPLDEEQQRQFENLLQTKSYAEVRAMNQTVYEKGIEKGRQEGRQEGQRDLICSLIEDRFGPVPEAVRQGLERMTPEQLRRVALKVATTASLADLGLPASRAEG